VIGEGRHQKGKDKREAAHLLLDEGEGDALAWVERNQRPVRQLLPLLAGLCLWSADSCFRVQERLEQLNVQTLPAARLRAAFPYGWVPPLWVQDAESFSNCHTPYSRCIRLPQSRDSRTRVVHDMCAWNNLSSLGPKPCAIHCRWLMAHLAAPRRQW